MNWEEHGATLPCISVGGAFVSPNMIPDASLSTCSRTLTPPLTASNNSVTTLEGKHNKHHAHKPWQDI